MATKKQQQTPPPDQGTGPATDPATNPAATAIPRNPFGSRAGDVLLQTVSGGARALWENGDLQKAGRQVLQGKIGLGTALQVAATPARKLLDRAVKEHGLIAQEDGVANRQLAEMLRQRRLEKGVRTMRRRGKDETVVRGVVTDPEGQPVPGLVVEGRRAGTKHATVLGVDVTDAKGRYQLVMNNEKLGRAKSPKIDLSIGLDRHAVLHAPDQPVTATTGASTDFDVALPAEPAARAQHALVDRDELDVARVNNLKRRNAMTKLQQEQVTNLAEGLGQLLRAWAGGSKR